MMNPTTKLPGERATGSSLLFDDSRSQRLAEIFAACFTLILQLRSAQDFGDPEVLRRRIKDLLDRAGQEALRAGIPSEDLREARFAIVAFIDETILASDWHRRDVWMARPLQLELYDRFDAGEEFFVRLEQLREQPALRAEALEVYYLCMALGFKGKYQLHGQEQLRILIEDTYSLLSRTPGMGRVALSPHGRPRDQIAAEIKNKFPTWVIVVLAVALGLIIYVGLQFYMGAAAEDAVEAINQATGAAG